MLQLTELGREFLVPARMSPSPAWFALTGTAPALVAGGRRHVGPRAPASLAVTTQN